MHDTMQMLHELCGMVEDNLKNAVQLLREKSGGHIDKTDATYVQQLTHSFKNILTSKAMLEAYDEEGESEGGVFKAGNGYGRGMYRDGGNYGRQGRTRMGRFRDGMGESYSATYRNDGREQMISMLEENAQSADNQTRMVLEEAIRKLRNN